MSASSVQPKATARERWAWYLYDFGNSAYAAVVLLAIYSAYFQGAVVGGAEGSRLWGIAVGIAMLTVAITAPVLGTLTDFSGSKKRFLLFYTILCCLFTAALFFVQRGDWFIGMLFFILAEVGYRSAQVFYNSLLPEIAGPGEIERVSGNGWAIGSVGGIVCLLIVLVPVVLTDGDALVIRLSLVFTGLYFALSTLPLVFWLRERAQAQPIPEGENYISIALKRLGHTIRSVKTFREFLLFIVAFLIYNDGILMVLDFGAILGAVLFGMEQQELIIFMIVVQVTSVAGAYLFGLLANWFSTKRSLVISLVLMIVPVLWLYWTRSRVDFYLIGALAGFALTGVQSLSRTFVGILSPPGKSAEFYGFFAVTGRTSSFIGPTVFGLLAAEATRWYVVNQQLSKLAAEQEGHRIALFSIIVFLVVGTVLFLLVNEKRGKQAAASVTE
ncbi:MAG: MFS transporter [Anaerolineae bacterium]|nr:MFS transporter [Anaerolineae bacterium]